MAEDEKADLRERIMSARVRLSQTMSRQRKANNALRRIINRMEILSAQNDLAIHSAWSGLQDLDGMLKELDDMLAAERYSVN